MTESTFQALARQNTGASFLDSGDAYGRHWEQPPVPEDHPLYYARRWGKDYEDVDLMINQPALLAEHFTIDAKATRHFRLWAALVDRDDRHYWGELARAYCARMVETDRWEGDEFTPPPEGCEDRIDWYANHSGVWQHYTYNDPDYNDLDQDFIVTAPSPYDSHVLVQSHNGCDARGGFSEPVVASGEDADPQYGITPYCTPCNAEADNMYQAGENGWRKVRLPDKVVLRCPNGHLDTWPEFPYYDGEGPEIDRFEPHEPEPDDSEEVCEHCGMDLIRSDGGLECAPPPAWIAAGAQKEQLPLAI